MSMPTLLTTPAAVVVGVLLATSGTAQGSRSHHAFDAPYGHPVEVSSDGSLLFAVNRPDDRLSVFRLTDPAQPILLREISVGVQPVSVRARTEDEVWVVNGLSDSVSVVSIREGRVIDTLRVVDEPGDVVFAGSPQRAFVSATARNEVHVFDAETREPLAVLPIRGRDPRALAVSPDGRDVYVASTRSGNGTTLVPHDLAPDARAGFRSDLPPAPLQGIIVSQDDAIFGDLGAMPQRDEDLFVIDAIGLSVTRAVKTVGTNLFGLDVDPRDGSIYVANSEARNLVRFEPTLKSHVADHRVTRVDPESGSVDSIFDLNPAIDYTVFPNPEALARALADPTDVVVDAKRDRLYVAAQGTDRIGVLDLDGGVLARLELSEASGTAVDSRTKRGTRALALHPSAPFLYALNGLSSSLSVIGLEPLKVLRELSVGHDPTPAAEKAGRGFLYDAKQSANGTSSCITCHVDLEWDALAWDLGNPDGEVVPKPTGQSFPFSLKLADYHPMKGPMTTQFLRGLEGQDPYHWRGDRATLRSFQSGFTELLGGPGLTDDEWDDLEAYVDSLLYQPNPNQLLDRTYETGDGVPNADDGAEFFFDRYISVGLPLPITCQICHQLPTATVNQVVSQQFAVETDKMDQFKVPTLRDVYRKTNPADAEGFHLSGFGLLHDGQAATSTHVVEGGKLARWPADELDDIAVYVEAIDTGAAPILGYQVALDAATAGDPAVLSDLDLLEDRAAALDCDLVIKGTLHGLRRGFVFDLASGTYLPDDPELPAYDRASLETLASGGEADLLFTAVGLGAGTRAGVDRDLDGLFDGVDGVSAYGDATAGCDGAAELFVNRAPRLGETNVTFTVGNVAPNGRVLLALSGAPAEITGHRGIELLVSPAAGLVLVEMESDASGYPVFSVNVPRAADVVGRTVFAQALYEDPCGAEGWAASNGLQVTVQE